MSGHELGLRLIIFLTGIRYGHIEGLHLHSSSITANDLGCP